MIRWVELGGWLTCAAGAQGPHTVTASRRFLLLGIIKMIPLIMYMLWKDADRV